MKYKIEESSYRGILVVYVEESVIFKKWKYWRKIESLWKSETREQDLQNALPYIEEYVKERNASKTKYLPIYGEV